MLGVQAAPDVDQVFAFVGFHRMDNGDAVGIDQGGITKGPFGGRVGMSGEEDHPVGSGSDGGRNMAEVERHPEIVAPDRHHPCHQQAEPPPSRSRRHEQT